MAMANGMLSLSPSISSNATSDARRLPVARANPLKPGSPKEIALINYLDEKILRITRRYGKKFSNEQADKDNSPGYTSFEEVSNDLNAVLDVVWISGTPNVQVPYLLTLAGMFCSYLPGFPFSTSTSMFSVVSKLDDAFAHFLRGRATTLVSTTNKVRIKSLVEETRVVAIGVASESGQTAHRDDSNDEDENDEDSDDQDDDFDKNPVSIQLGKIYRHTLGILGDSLV